MKTQLLGALALSIAASGAAYAGPHCGKMKQAYHNKPMYHPTVLMRYHGHPDMGGYRMIKAGHRAEKTADMAVSMMSGECFSYTGWPSLP